MKVCLVEQLCLQKPFFECDMRVCAPSIWQGTHVSARPCVCVCERPLLAPVAFACARRSTLSQTRILTHDLAQRPLDNWNGWLALDRA